MNFVLLMCVHEPMVLLSRQKLVLLLKISHATLTRGRVMIKKVQEQEKASYRSSSRRRQVEKRSRTCRPSRERRREVAAEQSGKFPHYEVLNLNILLTLMQPNTRQMWL
jgi:hypothetical protein